MRKLKHRKVWLAQGHTAEIRTKTQCSVTGLSKLPSPPTLITPSAGLLPTQDAAEAYPVTRDVRKLRTGSKTSWLIRGRMSMRVVSDRYTMIF